MTSLTSQSIVGNDGIPDGIAPDWVLALVVLLVGWYGSKLLVRAGRPYVVERMRRRSVAEIGLRIARAVVMLAAVFVILGIFGVELSDLLLSVTILSVVVGVILTPVASDLVGGLFVLANRPYEVGDMIELVDQEASGHVVDVTLRYTKIRTLENTFLVVPNSTIRERDVVNLSADDERSRVSIEFVVTYEGDLEEARTLLEEAAEEIDGVIEGGPGIAMGSTKYPVRPTAFIESFADHGVKLELNFWVERPYLPRVMRSKIHEAVWERLEDADVEIAYPHTHLVFDETSGTAQVAVDRAHGEIPSDTGSIDEQTAD
ncbi:mechanosensitive ion channel family protein [Natronorubrum daqingense]|uniref:Mechanosensitive ion channel protein MscS n=1 Tax=Natronorubrum daqingense TaxID=588898 RepID=A0A1N7CQK7_9EURY|nr:mechanosensitive ion channel family protein [Natronorubrum daqingense]APX97013.1 mechanosensitive ion channel protein MscS [Natronorubrum daqingense]SIR65850.1 Small-conductance mechanosensitive channel [Natronorubrum daqingense]